VVAIAPTPFLSPSSVVGCKQVRVASEGAAVSVSTSEKSAAAPCVPSFTGGVLLLASKEDGRLSGGRNYQHDGAPRGHWWFTSRPYHALVRLEGGYGMRV